MMKKILSLSILFFSSLPVSAKFNQYSPTYLENKNPVGKMVIDCSLIDNCLIDKRNVNEILMSQTYDEIYENEMIIKELF